jgi:type IV pilus assembly protein PilA
MKKTSRKGFTLVEIMIVVVIIGLLAAMAVPAFNKVREEARRKAIINNLRQVASAGQQYILENGVTDVKYKDLEGVYFNTIDPVAGESYKNLTVKETGGTLDVRTKGGMKVEYSY